MQCNYLKYKLIIFNLDGTVLQTLSDIVASVNYSLRLNNLPIRSEDEILSFIGHGSKYLITKSIGKDISEELFNKIFKDYKDYYKNHVYDFTKPYEGMFEVIKEFKDRGGLITLMSNKPNDLAQPLIAKFYPHLFDMVLGQADNIPVKPDITQTKNILDYFKILPKEAVFVGDSLVDYQTASNASIDCVLCNYGYENDKKPYTNVRL